MVCRTHENLSLGRKSDAVGTRPETRELGDRWRTCSVGVCIVCMASREDAGGPSVRSRACARVTCAHVMCPAHAAGLVGSPGTPEPGRYAMYARALW